MSEVFETDEHAYRACILYEVIHKNPLKEAYEKMKTVKPNIDFSDFEYWYFRFSNGRYDLKHDRTTDPSLADMPILVVENIVKNLGLVDKLSARKVCRSLRTVIDNQSSKFDRLQLTISEKYCALCCDDLRIKYFAKENGNYLLKTPRKSISSQGNLSLMAMREFASVITHPKWVFNVILIELKDCDLEYERKSVLFLNSMLSNHKFHVEKLRIDGRTFEPLATLLPLFEADRLYPRLISPFDDTQENLFEVIVEMDQWKNATMISIDSLSNEFPIEVLFCAREIVVYDDFKLTEDRLVKIRDILFKSQNFKYFEFRNKRDENQEELTALVYKVMGANSAYDPQNKIYRIEDSKDYIKISLPIEEEKNKGFQVFRIERIRS